MPFTFYSPPSLTAEQASPYGNLLHNALARYQEGIQASYARPMAEQAYQQAMVNTQKAKIISQLYSNIIGGMGGTNQQMQASPDQSFGTPERTNAISNIVDQGQRGNLGQGGYPVPNDRRSLVALANADQAAADRGLPEPSTQHGGQMMPKMGIPQGQPGSQQNQSNVTYPQAALASHLLGLGEPKITEIPGTGQQIAITPFGNIPIATGLSELQKSLAKENAKSIKELSDSAFAGQTKQATFDEIGKIITSPVYEQMRQTAALGKYELGYFKNFGNPEQQEMVGSLISLSGQVVKDTAQDFKGQFRKGEQSLVQDMKVNTGDTVYSARGKLAAMELMNKFLTQRSRLTADFMTRGMNQVQAQDEADKLINGDAVRKQINESLKTTQGKSISIKNRNTGEIKTISSDEAKEMGLQNG